MIWQKEEDEERGMITMQHRGKGGRKIKHNVGLNLHARAWKVRVVYLRLPRLLQEWVRQIHPRPARFPLLDRYHQR